MAELDSLRRAYRESGAGGDSVHLSEDRWERLACDELEPPERAAAFDHILACPQCSDAYRAIEVLRSEAAAFDAGAPAPRDMSPASSPPRRGPWRGLGFLALAATVVMAVVLPTLHRDQPSTDAAFQALRSTESWSPATPLAPVDQNVDWRARENLRLEWAAAEPQRPVVVEVLDADGELIWRSRDITDSHVGWPTAQATAPGRYYWRVVGTGAGDKQVASDLVSFQLVDETVTASPP